MNKALSSFATRLRGQIADSQFPITDFLALARELFALQFQHNPAYRRICEARRLTPGAVEHWAQIPAVPTAAFKELELTSLAPDERTAVFHSSGTTEARPSRHFHHAESLAVYEASLWTWFRQNGGAQMAAGGLISLTPAPGAVPHSSLVHMFETIRQKLDAPESAFVGTVAADGAWTVDFKAVRAALDSALVTRHPPLLLGTAFSFVHLLDYLVEQDLKFPVSAQARVLETGGYKNRSRAMPKAELHALITERLGVPPENILCEYGMSELSSQAYAVMNDERQVAAGTSAAQEAPRVTHHFKFPPWARVQLISPETGREVSEGETGLIRIFDLANVFSVAAVQTEDLGIRRGDGFELIGRAPRAEPRGCSRMTA